MQRTLCYKKVPRALSLSPTVFATRTATQNEHEIDPSHLPVHHGRNEVSDLNHILMVEVAHKLDLSQSALCIYKVLKGIGDFLDGHLLVKLGITGRAAGTKDKQSGTMGINVRLEQAWF